jgi:hypothetical protein
MAPMSTTPIPHDEIAIGDYVVIQNPYRSRFAIKVEKIGLIDGCRSYIVGRQFSIAASKREGLICFNQRTKLASLRSNTTVERFEVGR